MLARVTANMTRMTVQLVIGNDCDNYDQNDSDDDDDYNDNNDDDKAGDCNRDYDSCCSVS